MTDEELLKIEAFALAATPGPWRVNPHRGWELEREYGAGSIGHLADFSLNWAGSDVAWDQVLANTALSAAARKAIPDLICALRISRDVSRDMHVAAQAEIARLKRELELAEAEIDTLNARIGDLT
jgi:hypothetical protein